MSAGIREPSQPSLTSWIDNPQPFDLSIAEECFRKFSFFFFLSIENHDDRSMAIIVTFKRAALRSYPSPTTE